MTASTATTTSPAIALKGCTPEKGHRGSPPLQVERAPAGLFDDTPLGAAPHEVARVSGPMRQSEHTHDP